MQSPLLEPLAADLERLRSLADGDAAVPTCPGWTQRDLAAHVGGVARMAAGAVRGGVDGRVPRRQPPPEGFDPAAWVADGAADLLSALGDADPDSPVPMFTGTATPTWWCRRQAVEMAVHRVDAELATSTQGPVDPAVAAAGIEEWFDWVCLRPASRIESPASIGIATTDGGCWSATWDDDGYRWSRSGGNATVTLRGEASDVLLRLWGRPTLAPVEVLGDAGALTRLLEGTSV